MKKLILATVLNAVTVGSCLLSPAANAATNEFAPNDSIFTTPSETVIDEVDEWDAELSESVDEQQVAYSSICYWEYYPDGSSFWVCYY